jgi:hypothetical protein
MTTGASESRTAEFTPPPEAGRGFAFSWQDGAIVIKTGNGE